MPRYLVAIGLIASFWWVRSANVDLLEHWREAMGESTRPFTLNGLTVRLDRNVEPRVRQRGERGRYLLLISSDSCPYSLEQVDSWRQLLASITFAADDVVIHLSASGTTIAAALEALGGVPYQFLHSTDRAAFVAETGLSWTPAVALLDSDFRLQLVSSRVTPTVAAQIVTFFGNANAKK